MTPVLSVAVGSVHVTLNDEVPKGMVFVMELGQAMTTGGVVSAPTTVR